MALQSDVLPRVPVAYYDYLAAGELQGVPEVGGVHYPAVEIGETGEGDGGGDGEVTTRDYDVVEFWGKVGENSLKFGRSEVTDIDSFVLLLATPHLHSPPSHLPKPRNPPSPHPTQPAPPPPRI